MLWQQLNHNMNSKKILKEIRDYIVVVVTFVTTLTLLWYLVDKEGLLSGKHFLPTLGMGLSFGLALRLFGDSNG